MSLFFHRCNLQKQQGIQLLKDTFKSLGPHNLLFNALVWAPQNLAMPQPLLALKSGIWCANISPNILCNNSKRSFSPQHPQPFKLLRQLIYRPVVRQPSGKLHASLLPEMILFAFTSSAIACRGPFLASLFLDTISHVMLSMPLSLGSSHCGPLVSEGSIFLAQTSLWPFQGFRRC